MKNNKGGKKHKRAKNIIINDKVDIPEEGQYFGKVIKMLGSGRVNLNYYYKRDYNGDQKTEWTTINSIGIIRGNMMKRIYINIGDIVLITRREFEDKKVDIIGRYDQNQINYLKKEIPMPNIDNICDNDIEFDANDINDEAINEI